MAAKPATDAQCKQALRLFHKFEGNISRATSAAGLKAGSRGTFLDRITEGKKRFPDLAKQLTPKPKTIVEHAVDQRDKTAHRWRTRS